MTESLIQARSEDERLTLKVYENALGYWVYAIYDGDGLKPGSLKAAAGGFESLSKALSEATEALDRRLVIRDCDHDWQPWASTDACSKCGIVRGVSLGAPA